MRLITASQSRAARGLLNWSQPELAERCGMHVQTISSFEHEVGSPTKRTLQKITQTFVTAGIEFTSNGGVEPYQNKVITFVGRDGFAVFRADILAEAKTMPLDVCVSNVDEREFDKWGSGGVNQEYIDEMHRIKPERFRILIKENDDYLTVPGYASYRWLPESHFGKISFFIYGHKTAILSFEENNFHAFVISHRQINQFYRDEFERLWQLSKELPKKASNKAANQTNPSAPPSHFAGNAR